MRTKHSIVIRLINNPGAVIRIAMVLERRSYTIEALQVRPVLNGYSEMDLSITGDPGKFEQVQKQLEKLVDVAFVQGKARGVETTSLHLPVIAKHSIIFS